MSHFSIQSFLCSLISLSLASGIFSARLFAEDYVATETTEGSVTLHWTFENVMGPGVISETSITLHYTVDHSLGETTITGSALDEWGGPVELTIPDTLGGYPVVRIEGDSMQPIKRFVKSVVFPKGLKTIGSNLFTNAGYDVYYLTEIHLNESLESIGSRAFYNCGLVETLTIPKTVTTIGEDAFRLCDELTTVQFEGDAPEELGANAFNRNPDVSEVVKVYYYTGASGFENPSEHSGWNGCDFIRRDFTNGKYEVPGTEIILNYKRTGDPAHVEITGCSGGEEVEVDGETELVIAGDIVIPAEIDGLPVTVIGAHAFELEDGITGIDLPDTVVEIQERAFLGIGTRNFGDFNIPASVKRIGDAAFALAWFSSIFFEGDLPVLEGDFHFLQGNPDMLVGFYAGAAGLTTPNWNGFESQRIDYHGIYEVPNTNATLKYTRSGEPAKVKITGATLNEPLELVIPSTIDGFDVTLIENFAFSGEREIVSVTLPERLQTIGARAFSGCDALSEIIIPPSVNEIGNRAFENNSSLYRALFMGDAPPYIGEDVFESANASFQVEYYDGATGFSGSAWESYTSIELPLPDLDGDGWPDLLEEMLGTDPENASDHLRFWVEASGSNLELHYAPHSDLCDFQVWQTSDLSDPESWVLASDVIFSGDESEQASQITNDGANSVFYHLSVSR